MIYCLYHHPGETIGLIENALKSLRMPYKELHLHGGDGLPRDTSDLQALVLMGGPMSVHDVDEYPFLLEELRLLERVLAQGKPILGICLGAQLIAKAAGARVYAQGFKELGWAPVHISHEGKRDPLWAKLPKSVDVFHWHGDTFGLPDGAVRLAGSERCANQAFRLGENVYGLQFHFELTPAMIRTWMRDRACRDEARSQGQDPDEIAHSAEAGCEKIRPVAEAFFGSFFRRALARVTVTV